MVADFLSRLPIEADVYEADSPDEEINVLQGSVGPRMSMNLRMIEEETVKDKTLTTLKTFLMKGWPKSVSIEFVEYRKASEKLSIEDGVITMDGRVVVPENLRAKVLEIIHQGHLGMVRMKQVVRRYVYWPGVNKDVEKCAKTCEICCMVNIDHSAKHFVPWPIPKEPFERVHIDFFFLLNETFLIVVDAFSKWTDVKLMKKTNAEKTWAVLSELFQIFGWPKILVADNGPPFQSEEFSRSCENFGIELKHSPPYFPQSNGQAERAVQSAKVFLTKRIVEIDANHYSKNDLKEIVCEYLKYQRHTPNYEGKTPSHLLFSYQPRTVLDVMFQKRGSESGLTKSAMKSVKGLKVFEVGQKAWYKNPLNKFVKRVECEIREKCGNNAYYVTLRTGKTVLASSNQLTMRVVVDQPDEHVAEPCTPESTGRPKRTIRAPQRFES